MSTSKIAEHYTRLLSLWPKDLLRPNQSFSIPLSYRAVLFGVKPTSSQLEAQKEKKTQSPSAKDAAPTSRPIAPPDPKSELANLNALYSLLENRYSIRYKLSRGVLTPTSNPEHYSRLMEEIERAPNKTWWQAKVDEWKGKIRFS